MPEETPFMDSSVSSEEKEQNHFFSMDDHPNDQTTTPTNDYHYPNDNQDGQDWPDDISDTHK